MPYNERSRDNLARGRVVAPTKGIENMPIVIQQIEHARVAAGLSMTELCEKAGVSAQTWNFCVNRGTSVGYMNLINLAETVGLRIEARDAYDLELFPD